MALRLPRFFLLFVLLALFTGVPSFAEFYTDWLWYREVGYEQFFLKSLSAQAPPPASSPASLVFVVLWLNLHLALRPLRRREFTITTPDGPRVITVDTRRMRVAHVRGRAGPARLCSASIPDSSWATWLYALQRGAVRPDRSGARPRHRLLLFRLPLLELGPRASRLRP